MSEYSIMHPNQAGTESEFSATTDASECSSDTKRSRFSSLFSSRSKSSFSFLNYHCKVDISVQKRVKKKTLFKKNNPDTPTPKTPAAEADYASESDSLASRSETTVDNNCDVSLALRQSPSAGMPSSVIVGPSQSPQLPVESLNAPALRTKATVGL